MQNEKYLKSSSKMYSITFLIFTGTHARRGSVTRYEDAQYVNVYLRIHFYILARDCKSFCPRGINIDKWVLMCFTAPFTKILCA